MNKGIFALILTSFLYAALALPTRYLEGVNTFFLICTAFTFVTLVSYAILKFKKNFNFKSEFLKSKNDFLILGLSHVACSLCINYAIKLIDLSLAGLLLFTAPVWVFAYSVVKKQISFNLKNLLVLIIGLIAILLIISPWKVDQLKVNILGLSLAIASGILFSADFIIGEKLRKVHNELEVLCIIHAIGAVVLIPNIIFWPKIDQFSQVALIFSFDVILLLSFLSFLYGIKFVKAFYASVITMLEPLLLGILGFLLFNEKPSMYVLLGGILIFGNIVYLNLPTNKSLIKPKVSFWQRLQLVLGRFGK